MDDDGVAGWSGGLEPWPMVGAFEVVFAHLAFDHAGERSQPAWGQSVGEDLGDGQSGRAEEPVRGKRPPG